MFRLKADNGYAAAKPLPLIINCGFLDFSYRDGIRIANLDTGLATQTFVFVDRICFSINEFKNAGRAGADTLFATYTFLLIHNYFKHCLSPW